MLSLSGCGENAIVNIYDKTIFQEKTTCLRLLVFPPDQEIEQTLRSLYSFDRNCTFNLEVSTKSGIVCNSNQNSDKKALSNFSTGYLRMQITQNAKPLYDYYIDLTAEVKKSDVKNAFRRLEKDLVLN